MDQEGTLGRDAVPPWNCPCELGLAFAGQPDLCRISIYISDRDSLAARIGADYREPRDWSTSLPCDCGRTLDHECIPTERLGTD